MEQEKSYNQQLLEIFVDSPELLERLIKLDEKKKEIAILKQENGKLAKPLVITLTGTPRAGKTTCIVKIYNFLKKANLKTVYLKEPAGLIYEKLKNKEEKEELLKDRVRFVEQQYKIGTDYIKNHLQNNDVILCDRGVLDTFVWYDMYYQMGLLNNDKYQEFLLKLNYKDNYYNQLYALLTNVNVAIKRDYLNSLSIEERTTTNYKNILRYNKSLLKMLKIMEEQVDMVNIIDTTKTTEMDLSIKVANNVLDGVKKLYLRR